MWVVGNNVGLQTYAGKLKTIKTSAETINQRGCAKEKKEKVKYNKINRMLKQRGTCLGILNKNINGS